MDGIYHGGMAHESSNKPVIPIVIAQDIKNCLKTLGQIMLQNIRLNFRTFTQLSAKSGIDQILTQVLCTVYHRYRRS